MSVADKAVNGDVELVYDRPVTPVPMFAFAAVFHIGPVLNDNNGVVLVTDNPESEFTTFT